MSVPEVLSATSPDLSAIITSLGIFSLAVAATVAGLYKGIKEIRGNGSGGGTTAGVAEKHTVLSPELISILRDIERHMDRTRDIDERLRASTEEMHRLRVAITDAHQFIRSRLP